MPIVNQTGLSLFDNTVEGRLTLSSGNPVTTSDQNAQTTIYFSPYDGDHIALWNGTMWVVYEFSEMSQSVPAVANKVYDAFIYDNSGTLTFDFTAWTDDVTRATALDKLNGIYVKNGAQQRRYVGSFRTKTAGQCSDSNAFRHVWNYYNRVRKPMVIKDTGQWAAPAASNTYRQANANTANQLDFLIGVSEDVVIADAASIYFDTANTTLNGTGIGLDSVTVSSANIMQWSHAAVLNLWTGSKANYSDYPGIGRHYLAWLEAASNSGVVTGAFLGDAGVPNLVQAGIYGSILC